MIGTLTNSNFNFSFQEKVYHGKVRDVYYLKNNLVVMVASDRISAFDVVMPKGIPFKGQILNQIAVWGSPMGPSVPRARAGNLPQAPAQKFF